MLKKTDPLISSLRQKPLKKSKCFSSETLLLLMPEELLNIEDNAIVSENESEDEVGSGESESDDSDFFFFISSYTFFYLY